MESPRVEEILEALKWLSLTPDRRKGTRPPDLTPLSELEFRALLAAAEAAEVGIDVPRILEADILAERMLQTAQDRKRGTLGSEMPGILAVLEGDPFAIHGYRTRRRLLMFLSGCDDRGARTILRRLIASQRPEEASVPRGVVAETFFRARGLRESGRSAADAVRAVARGEAAPVPNELRDALLHWRANDSEEWQEVQAEYPHPPRTEDLREFPPTDPISIGRVQYLLRLARTPFRLPPTAKLHKRPGRNKRESPGHPANSEPKTGKKEGLSTLPLGETTAAERGQDDELPHDNRSRHPAQGAAPDPPGVEAQRKGAAILKAVRKPRSVRGGGAGPVPRGSDVRSHGRGDGSARKRPGRVKVPP